MSSDSEISYDFICLCCGARNGANIPECTYNQYVTASDDDSLAQALQLSSWFRSSDYKGSLLVPEGYQLDTDYRLRIVRMTESFRRKRRCLLLFTLPGVNDVNSIPLSSFMD